MEATPLLQVEPVKADIPSERVQAARVHVLGPEQEKDHLCLPLYAPPLRPRGSAPVFTPSDIPALPSQAPWAYDQSPVQESRVLYTVVLLVLIPTLCCLGRVSPVQLRGELANRTRERTSEEIQMDWRTLVTAVFGGAGRFSDADA